MGWLDAWRRSGLQIGFTMRFGWQGKLPDPEDLHCLECGVKRRDHKSVPHVFRVVPL